MVDLHFCVSLYIFFFVFDSGCFFVVVVGSVPAERIFICLSTENYRMSSCVLWVYEFLRKFNQREGDLIQQLSKLSLCKQKFLNWKLCNAFEKLDKNHYDLSSPSHSKYRFVNLIWMNRNRNTKYFDFGIFKEVFLHIFFLE